MVLTSSDGADPPCSSMLVCLRAVGISVAYERPSKSEEADHNMHSAQHCFSLHLSVTENQEALSMDPVS